jgi:hypothetical protein
MPFSSALKAQIGTDVSDRLPVSQAARSQHIHEPAHGSFLPPIIAAGDLRKQFIVLCSGNAAAAEAVALLSLVASLEGFEPTTRCLEGSRSIQLSYRDNQIKYSMIGLE